MSVAVHTSRFQYRLMLDMTVDKEHTLGQRSLGTQTPTQKVQDTKILFCKPKQQACNTIFFNQINNDMTGNTSTFIFLGSDDIMEARYSSEILKPKS